MAEALRARAADPDPAAGRQEPGDPPADQERDWQSEERDRQDRDQERQREPEDDFSDSWQTYRGARRSDPPDPRLDGPAAAAGRAVAAIGRDDDQERDSDREDR